jgi:hypothetical protein
MHTTRATALRSLFHLCLIYLLFYDCFAVIAVDADIHSDSDFHPEADLSTAPFRRTFNVSPLNIPLLLRLSFSSFDLSYLLILTLLSFLESQGTIL